MKVYAVQIREADGVVRTVETTDSESAARRRAATLGGTVVVFASVGAAYGDDR